MGASSTCPIPWHLWHLPRHLAPHTLAPGTYPGTWPLAPHTLAPGTYAVPVVAMQARAFYGFQVAIENIHSGKTWLSS